MMKATKRTSDRAAFGGVVLLVMVFAALAVASDANAQVTHRVWGDVLLGVITDADALGVTATARVTTQGRLLDLNVFLGISHNRVGDLCVTLRHVDSGTTVTLIQRPGDDTLLCDGASCGGCASGGIDATLDDEATSSAEEACDAAFPAIGGFVFPAEALSAFDGENFAGRWELTVSDHCASVVGSLGSWRLEAILADQNASEAGYAVRDSDDPAGPVFDFIDISGTGAQVVEGDDRTNLRPPPDGIDGPIVLGAPFEFYGQTYTELTMSSNGWLSTDTVGAASDYTNDCPLPAAPSVPTGTTGARIYVLHDDLDLQPGIGTGHYQYFSACPRSSDSGCENEGCHVFMWNDVAQYPGGPDADTFDIEAILYDNGDIVFQYGAGNPKTGAGSTTGIQSEATGEAWTPPEFGITYACNTHGSIPDNFAIWFIPDADDDGLSDHGDADCDGTENAADGCPLDPNKIEPGLGGCGSPDTDGDGVPDSFDPCPDDAAKLEPGLCGCGNPDTDGDGDGVPDCFDECPDDAAKLEPGICGCGTPDSLDDADDDGVIDCLDNCPAAPNADQADADGNGIGDVCEDQPAGLPGLCGVPAAGGAMALPIMLVGVGWMKRRHRAMLRHRR